MGSGNPTIPLQPPPPHLSSGHSKVVFHLDRLRKEKCARGFASSISDQLTVLENHTCHVAHVNGNRNLCNSLVCRDQTLLRRDKELFIRNLAEEVEIYVLISILAYQALRKLDSCLPCSLLNGWKGSSVIMMGFVNVGPSILNNCFR